MDQKRFSILIADLHPIACEGVRALAESTSDFEVIEAVQSLPAALESARRLAPSLVAVDKGFGFQELLAFLAEMRTAGVNSAVVIWGALISEAEVLRFVQAGAKGVVRKTVALPELLDCLRSAAAGTVWVATAAPQPHAAEDAHSPRLTTRERQVVDLVLQGMRNREIAAELGMRPGTVKVHLKHIFEKTGIRGRYGLALSCLQTKTRSAGA